MTKQRDEEHEDLQYCEEHLRKVLTSFGYDIIKLERKLAPLTHEKEGVMFTLELFEPV